MYHQYHKRQISLILIWVAWYCTIGRTSLLLVDAKKQDADEYLYHTEDAAGIIIDYEPPPEVSDKNKDLNRPDFLYGPNQGPRIVEFYAPWCPHVRVSCQPYPRSFLSSSKYSLYLQSSYLFP
jgi:hypothetical protein